MSHVLRPRWVVAASYVLYSTAGLAFMFLPTTGLRELLGWFGFAVWNFMLSIGGGIGLIGAIRKKHRIEMIGIPGVITGLAVYAIYIISQVRVSDAPGVIIGFSCICAGAAFGGIGRAYEIYYLSRVYGRVSEQIKQEREES